VTLLSIFANHGIAVPLCTTHPNHELRYIVDNSEALVLLSSDKFREKAEDVIKEDIRNKPIVAVEKIKEGKKSSEHITLEPPKSEEGGMMLYTSGTTSRPKGVVLPQPVLTAQVRSLMQAWRYEKEDYLLHCLPLHHIHGTVNALLTPLYAGSTIEFLFPFNATAVWQRFAVPFLPPKATMSGTSESASTSTANSASTSSVSLAPSHNEVPGSLLPPQAITFFTVVPTIYQRLLSTFSTLDEETQKAAKTALHPSNLRLNISGSAALPTPTKQAWSDLTGDNVLLERYGMTEVGMALSCGLDFQDRVDGSVGWPLPSVEVRLVDTETGEVIESGQNLDSRGVERQGEIQLRGPTVFRDYWRNPAATAAEFVEGEDGRGKWFKTGDVAVRRRVPGAGLGKQEWCKGPAYFILGRKSADIIKTGGEKVSALEVEREILSLPEISECAVVGLPSEQWGQKVAAVIVLSEAGKTAGGKGGKQFGSAMDLRRRLRDVLANYKIPQEVRVVEGLPKNAMGKINKKALVREIFGDVLEK
jgi:malonyl-CoA/methylmalonyl-CoA synthetase